MYDALVHGEVDVISAFTSDGGIAAHELVLLEDTQDALPPYGAILLLSRAARERPALMAALEPLMGRIDVEAMQRANYMVDREAEARTVARAAAWLRRRALDDGRFDEDT